jgi:release factor glutamine methyltransferase
MLTIGQAVLTAKTQIEAVSDSANLDAQVLLAEVIAQDRAYLLAHPERALTDAQQEHFATLVNRRAAGEPVAYILGRRAFYDRDIAVAPGVLIPRPETELLLEQALAWVGTQPEAVVVDVGTGSGALAVTLAAHAPTATVYATDISPQALMIARYNAFLSNVEVQFFQGNLLEPLIERGLQVDVVMANLPYIASDVLPDLAVSRYEPRLALDGGADGLVLIRDLLLQLPAVCNPGALVLLEIGADQGVAGLEAAKNALSTQAAAVLQDYAGHDRIVKAVLT